MERHPQKLQHRVQILTLSFHFTGYLETVGPPTEFLDAEHRDGLVLYDARLAPLTPGGMVKGLSQPQVTIRRREIVLLHLADAESQATIRTLPRRELLIAYTPLAVVRGAFHLPTEAAMTDFLSTTPGELLPVRDVLLFLLSPPPLTFPDRADLMLVGRRHIQFYHRA